MNAKVENVGEYGRKENEETARRGLKVKDSRQRGKRKNSKRKESKDGIGEEKNV